MKIVTTRAELRSGQAGRPAVVLVPTMGALHEGHLSLVRKARELAGSQGTVMVSIFVNPLQFDRKEDLSAYPETLEQDLAHCRELGVDLVFVPAAGEMYDGDRSTTVCEGDLSRPFCGASRPGHFDGVCTVVLKLFHLTGCRQAVFGEKDFQQLAVIRRMVRDLDVPVEIVSCSTVRESDGLAMSSRNVRLSAEQRREAPCIRQALLDAAASGGSGPERVEMVRRRLEASGRARVDYVGLLDAETFREISATTKRGVLAVAVFFGDVRLIDHIHVDFPP